MSFSTTLNYNNGSNFTYDTAKIDVTSAARLKLNNNTGLTFSQNYSSSTGFTYDNAKAEFSGGILRQKNQRPTDATFGATYTDSIDGSWGNGTLTGTAYDGASVAGGLLDCTGGTKGVTYPATGNADSQQTGAVRMKVKPNYSGTPAAICFIFSISEDVGVYNNLLALYHDNATGNLILSARDSAGNYIIPSSQLGVWNPTSGTTYEFELNYNFTGGVTKLFIDGNQFGATKTQTGTRSSAIGLLFIGMGASGTAFTNMYFDDVEIFSTVQHTPNYTPGYSVPERDYLASKADCPAFTYPGAGTIQAYSAFSSTITDTPKFIVNNKYWTGAAWAASDGSYSQSNDVATINTNISTLTAVSSTVLSVTFQDTNTQAGVDLSTITYTGQHYLTTNPSIINNSGVYADGLDGFIEYSTKPTNTEIKYQLDCSGVRKWFNGSAWATATADLYTQANTAAEIEANKASLNITSGTLLKVAALLHTSDEMATPVLTSVTEDYNYYSPMPASPDICLVYGHVRDIEGVTVTSAGDLLVGTTVYHAAALRVTNTLFFHSSNTIKPCIKVANIDPYGEFEIPLIETETVSKKYLFEIMYVDENNYPSSQIIGYAEVPDSTDANIATFTFTETP